MLNAGANVDATSDDSSTAVSIAAETSGKYEILKLLIAKGAKPGIADRYGVTPLMKAAKNGNADLAAILLKAGASPDAADQSNLTARQHAENRGDDAGAAVAKLFDKP